MALSCILILIWGKILTKINEISVLIAGEAGAGIFRSGFLFAKTCIRGGLFVFGTNDYPSLVRGGHNFYVARAGEEERRSRSDNIDLLIALNEQSIDIHKNELAEDSGVIYDSDAAPESRIFDGTKFKLYPIPLRQIVQNELKQELIMRNTVALGATVALLNYEISLLEDVLRDTFGSDVAVLNIRAARKGYEYFKQNFEDDFGFKLERTRNNVKERIFLSGNEAISLAAIQAGCKFYAAYPMTPSTGILEFLARNERESRMITIHPEGEIAAINMAAGAAFAGARAMVATSGGGFCLMTEALGMLGMTETPVVIVVGQRPGPSTGLPTYSAQGDLRFVLHASQGEFPRVVVAPGDWNECFYETLRAFNWADKYQLPVIILTDKHLAESQMSVEPFDTHLVGIERGSLLTDWPESAESYGKYGITETGVSPRIFPSTKGVVVRANADEHGELGYTAEDAETSTEMIDKRMRKLDYLVQELDDLSIETTKFYGREDAGLTLVSWGSTKGAIMDAMKVLAQGGLNVGFLQIVYLLPFPRRSVEGVLNNAKKIVVVENNRTSQLSSLIREHLLIDPDSKIVKYDGRPFTSDYLANRIKKELLL